MFTKVSMVKVSLQPRLPFSWRKPLLLIFFGILSQANAFPHLPPVFNTSCSFVFI